ncbi:FitA-like ribbon-helix-helix domain-containing protein [Pseudomonas amygdali]|uniref:FitA-like ribbon-helix-helix domain-containing protein n=1 Tax=Pseudomonas amygdali TaxID=47877 RepID=UPI0007607911|nr:hypothetical protein [Pseudomonas amygdali]KWS65739.1 hypothetical protein AL054_25580 [Pseudomonas amygdali pv. morsprunorum]POP86270.1 hypothetical protein CXB39_30000 [Pseudomonas amygdali pv. morsprunorum]
MARLSIRDFPDDLYIQLTQSAAQNYRSLEGEVRFGLAAYAKSLLQTATPPRTHLDRWRHEVGQRIHQLFQQLTADQVFAYNQRSDLPHLALLLGESSPALLINCVDGHESLPFDLAHRLVEHFSCNLSWLISGAGEMFPYPDLGPYYAEFFKPAHTDSSIRIKMVRICGGIHDATLLLFRLDENRQHIAAGYCSTQFDLSGNMGGTGFGKFAEFAEHLASLGSMKCEAYNFDATDNDGEFGHHHPKYYLNLARLNTARWLMPLLKGVAPNNIEWVAS